MPMGRDQNDIALRIQAHGAGLILPPEVREDEIASALCRLAKEPQFGVAARRWEKRLSARSTQSALSVRWKKIVNAYCQKSN
jgi:hypothetical protein